MVIITLEILIVVEHFIWPNLNTVFIIMEMVEQVQIYLGILQMEIILLSLLFQDEVTHLINGLIRERDGNPALTGLYVVVITQKLHSGQLISTMYLLMITELIPEILMMRQRHMIVTLPFRKMDIKRKVTNSWVGALMKTQHLLSIPQDRLLPIKQTEIPYFMLYGQKVILK